MNLVIWTYIFGGATVFGLIVGVFSVWNGRMTRRELSDVIERGDKRTHDLLERMNGHMQEMDRHMQELGRHMQEMDRRHTELLSQLLKQAS